MSTYHLPALLSNRARQLEQGGCERLIMANRPSIQESGDYTNTIQRIYKIGTYKFEQCQTCITLSATTEIASVLPSDSCSRI